MGGQNSNNRAAVSVSVDNGTITVTNEAVREFVIYGPDAEGFYTIYDGEESGYLYAAGSGSGSNYLRTQTTNNSNGKWSISIDNNDGKATVVAQGDNSNKYMRFNNTLFSCYGESSSVTNLVYFYEKAGDPVATTASVKLNGNGYATFAQLP